MDRSREHTAAFTGHRRYDGECDDALRAVVRELYGRGFRVFWSGMALGFDLAAAEAVFALRGELPGIDCGACGAPNCRAFAEDVVRGVASRADCIVERSRRADGDAGREEDPV